MLEPNRIDEIPEMTVEVAKAAFPKGNMVMAIRDALGPLFEDEEFAELYPTKGQPAESPARLAMVTILQFMENLTDRAAAEAVRSRIDWKYLLGLALTDAGFHYSVLSEFRQRLLEGGQEAVLLEKIIQRCDEKELLSGKKKQRTDSTHVLAKIGAVNRIERMGEMMRRVLNDIAKEAPAWLQPLIRPEWGKRYGRRVDTHGLSQSKQRALLQQIGEDGFYLLEQIYQVTTPAAIKAMGSVATMRLMWLQQFYRDENGLFARTKKSYGLPAARNMVLSPNDEEARYAAKGSTEWIGYKVHLTETCAAEAPRLITQLTTTVAPVPDMAVTASIQQELIAKGLKPEDHFCDGAYVDVEIMAQAQKDGVNLVGPVHQDSSWQAQANTGYDLSHFVIDWNKMTATCPQGQVSARWKKRTNIYGQPDFRFEFRFQSCHDCSARALCTRAQKYGRQLTVYPQPLHELLLQARQQQATEAFKQSYKRRAGIEGTISQAVNKMDIRRARYWGLAKTHLQHLATAAAINLQRVAAWLMGDRPEATRHSPFAALAIPL